MQVDEDQDEEDNRDEVPVQNVNSPEHNVVDDEQIDENDLEEEKEENIDDEIPDEFQPSQEYDENQLRRAPNSYA